MGDISDVVFDSYINEYHEVAGSFAGVTVYLRLCAKHLQKRSHQGQNNTEGFTRGLPNRTWAVIAVSLSVCVGNIFMPRARLHLSQ